ncbi:aryl-alcohol dehydrogenase-like predicted oxidoreductase [Nitrospirillum amazonense]|uniref:Aryl-alcohol dehydrogenase-like predicted oxidoreductase n=1 Tax=Nitrospirillum amazonense TaxID=28077 RepID=A0A560F9W7_9PROT|nr:aldo/keto reductase [Nitrospirillum amazonense]TWB18416.1 aryl-alcohol dehydrogenase-like predicted oxidoreductase [Nitrospirillum amazonense]
MLERVALHSALPAVSRLCLGTNMFGTAVDQVRANALLDAFAALGGNFIDTARSYGDWIPDAPKGASERAVGAWMKGRRRQDIVLATKGGFFDLKVMDYRKRVNPEDIASDLAESLEHLQTDYIDLYWLHTDDDTQPAGALVDALIEHQQAGRIRQFGASNWSPARLEEARAYAQAIGHDGFIACQPFWGLAVPNREVAAVSGYGPYYEDGFQPVHAAGLAMVPYSGQSRGFFTKLAASGEQGLPDDLKAMYVNEANRHRLAALTRVAEIHGVGLNTAALAYLTSQPHLTVPIIGASKPEQLAESARATALTLSAAELAALATA